MERKTSIDLLRILSALAVILIHVVSAPVGNSAAEVDLTLRINLNLIHILMNWSVPVFFMITGYCLLKKQKLTYEYCFACVLKYICVLFTIGFAYALMEEVFTAGTINASVLVQSVLNVVSGNLWDHMWFVYEIIGIYLVMPVIHLFMQQGKREAFILTALLFVFNILFPTLEDTIAIGVNLPLGRYLFYVCFGGVVAKQGVGRKASNIIYLTGLLSLVWILLDAKNTTFEYDHVAISAITMSIFLIVSAMEVKQNKLILCIAQCTWGIYLIHPFFINVVLKVFRVDLLSSYAYMKLAVFWVAIALVSFFTAYILRKLPLVKKFL